MFQFDEYDICVLEREEFEQNAEAQKNRQKVVSVDESAQPTDCGSCTGTCYSGCDGTCRRSQY